MGWARPCAIAWLNKRTFTRFYSRNSAWIHRRGPLSRTLSFHYPKGIASLSPGLREALPWVKRRKHFLPQRACSNRSHALDRTRVRRMKIAAQKESFDKNRHRAYSFTRAAVS